MNLIGEIILWLVTGPPFFAIYIFWRFYRRKHPDKLELTNIFLRVWLCVLILFNFISVFVAPLDISCALNKYWPFSITQGPNTFYAKRVFNSILNPLSPDDVGEIYGFQLIRAMDANISFLRFGAEKISIEQIVKTLRFNTEDQVGHESQRIMRVFKGPSWWIGPEIYEKCETIYLNETNFLCVSLDKNIYIVKFYVQFNSLIISADSSYANLLPRSENHPPTLLSD